MSEEPAKETKFTVKIYGIEKPRKVPKSVKQMLKGVASGKMMSRMKKEEIHCPVLEKERCFLECFACESFIRRVSGEVHCAGLKATIFD
tara:strand:+ start:151 stop:417 length:267 start_codon:yes stop_codon:yes gene_type:complete